MKRSIFAIFVQQTNAKPDRTITESSDGKGSSPDEALLVIADYLQKLLRNVEDLHRLTEKVSPT
jgi:hypothetical protein